MANQFFGFSPESFEQFVRALALSVFGPGVTAFGNGPDGGREAIFGGEVPYPYPPATLWSGYGVIQAKCKEKSEATDEDQKWALKLLEDELKSFVKSEKRDPKPEYYVFVTNVDLSSVAGGGRDKANTLVQLYYDKLPLKGHAIWDANQLAAFVSKYEDLRRSFSAYLTPGDILAEMLTDLEKRQPNATRILTAFLDRELRSDESSRLDQAGNRTDEQLRLAHLFFDLPATDQQQLSPPDEEPDEAGKLPPGILQELLRDGSRKLDPNTNSQQFRTRYVLLGGPGSGKSTVGQFLAQIHRAALLSRRNPIHLEERTRRNIDEIRRLCDQDGLPWPTTPRYPFRVELNRFAKALVSKDSDRVESLAGYLLKDLKREYSLSHEDFIEWLSIYPWLLILDGLDEVPVTGNRDSVVKAVNDFLAEARQVEADLFVLATSRQQGYNGEFADGHVAYRHIQPLSTARALQYVERYAQARFGSGDSNRAKDLIEKLRESATRELTAQLMSSPLQVTFMATVVAASGTPGEDRWQLFSNYYQTIYDRERQKAVLPFNTVLSKHKAIIDRLHHDVGFWLQYQGETANNDAVRLSITHFERLVDAYVAETGQEDEERKLLVRLITEAAHHRLVFLTSRIPNELSFDIRSLQEYMASECLMTGDSDVMKDRLRAIAPFPYWRNVFLFAASKCFADAQSRRLQDSIRVLCEDLNNSTDPMLAYKRAGSELALDILQSGVVAEYPLHARELARKALKLVSTPYLTGEAEGGASADQRLAIVYRDSLSAVYREGLELRIGQTDVNRSLGTWPLLIRLMERGIGWATELAEQSWPDDVQAQLQILKFFESELAHTTWAFKKLDGLITAISPDAMGSLTHRFVTDSGMPDALASVWRFVHQWRGHSAINLRVCSEDRQGFRLNIALISRSTESIKSFVEFARILNPAAGWLPFVLAHDFLLSPDRLTLATVLRKCVNGGWEPAKSFFISQLPWPLAACLQAVQSSQELMPLADRIEYGALGDTEDWVAAENRWESQGVEIIDLVNAPSGLEPFDRSIASVGFPAFRTIIGVDRYGYHHTVLEALFSAAEQSQSVMVRERIMHLFFSAAQGTTGIARYIDPTRFQTLLGGLHSPGWWDGCIIERPQEAVVVDPWIEFFDWLGRSEILSLYYRTNEFDRSWAGILQRAFIDNPTQVGLIRLLGRSAVSGYSCSLIPDEMLTLDSEVAPRFRLAALLIRLTRPSLTQEEAIYLADMAVTLLAPLVEPGADKLLFWTVQHQIGKVPAIEQFLLQVHRQMPPGVHLGLATCERLLRRVLRSRTSDLQAPGQLQALQLPMVPSSARTQ